MSDLFTTTATLPALPTVLRGGAALAKAQWWLAGWGRHAAWIAALAPVAGLVGVFIIGTVFFELFCTYGGDCEGVGVGLIALYLIATALLFLLSLATVFARGARDRRLQQAQARHIPRLQGLKDWFMRGDITENDYDRLKNVIEPATKGETADAKAQEAGAFLSWFGALSCTLVALLVPFDFVLAFEAGSEGGGMLVVLIVFASTVLIATTAVLCLVRGAQIKADAVQLAGDLEKEITRLEEELLRAGHSRKRGVLGAGPSTGPAFSPYARR